MRELTAAVATAPGTAFEIHQLTLDAPRDDEVVVRIAGVGICHSDIAAREQQLPVPLPAVLGHEGSGVVEFVGKNVSDLSPGDNVVLSFLSCGACFTCSSGNPSYCERGFLPQNFSCKRSDGSSTIHNDGQEIHGNFFGQSSFANFALAKSVNAIKVRSDAPLELLGPLGCGVQTGAGSILEVMKCHEGSDILITGGGAVGLAAVMAASICDCRNIIVSEPHKARRQLALEIGATHVIDPTASDSLSDEVRSIVSVGVDYAFDTTASQAVINSIVSVMKPLGTLGLVGVPTDNPSISFDVISMLALGLKVHGITEGGVNPKVFIPHLVDLFLEGRFPLDRLCTQYPLIEINSAIEEVHNGSCVKAILIP